MVVDNPFIEALFPGGWHWGWAPEILKKCWLQKHPTSSLLKHAQTQSLSHFLQCYLMGFATSFS